MNKRGYYFSFIVLIAIATFSFSCSKKTACSDFKCYNGGLKEGGGTNCTCICPRGYIGNNCDTEYRYTFLGNYSAQCYDNNGFSCGNFTLLVGTSTDSVTALSLGLNTMTLKGTIDPDNANVDIPSQAIGGTTYTGTGVFKSGTITLTVNSVNGSNFEVNYYQGPKQ